MRRGNGRTLITGASAGIGLELSREFARHGHPVILMARNEPRLKEIANQAHHVKVTEHLKNLAPLQRLGEPADIASVVSFLADQWPSSAR